MNALQGVAAWLRAALVDFVEALGCVAVLCLAVIVAGLPAIVILVALGVLEVRW